MHYTTAKKLRPEHQEIKKKNRICEQNWPPLWGPDRASEKVPIVILLKKQLEIDKICPSDRSGLKTGGQFLLPQIENKCEKKTLKS
jgi:hypothetical protein